MVGTLTPRVRSSPPAGAPHPAEAQRRALRHADLPTTVRIAKAADLLRQARRQQCNSLRKQNEWALVRIAAECQAGQQIAHLGLTRGGSKARPAPLLKELGVSKDTVARWRKVYQLSVETPR